MSYRIVFHPQAEKEFTEAYKWYEARVSGLGDHFTSAVDEKLKLISRKPLYYQKKKGEFREAKVKTFPYVVVYKIFEKQKIVFVSAVYHTKRNPKRKYRKK